MVCFESIPPEAAMTEGITAGHCAMCEYDFPDPIAFSAEPVGTPCPQCGASAPVFEVSASDSAHFHEFAGTKGKRPGKKRPYIETQAGDQKEEDSGRWMEKFRRIDRDGDRYDEVVVDQETGEIVHECHEPLSEHWGHGSAKEPPA
jgi:hypothetical protein